MAIKLEASLDDKKFISALDRMTGKMKETGAAGAAAGKKLDEVANNRGRLESIENFGKSMGKIRATLNNVMLAGAGMKIIGQVGDYIAETWGKVAEETKGVNKELYDQAKAWDTVSKAMKLDVGGVLNNMINKNVDFEAARIDKLSKPLIERNKVIDERNQRLGERETGLVTNRITAEQRINALVFQREDIEAQAKANELRRTNDQFMSQKDLTDQLLRYAKENARSMTDFESKVIAVRIGLAGQAEERRRAFDTDKLILAVHEDLDFQLKLETIHAQDLSREMDKVSALLKDQATGAEERDKAEQRFIALTKRQIEMKREELALEEQLRKANLDRFAAEEKARQEARKDRADKVGAAVNQMLGARGGDGAQTRRRGLGSMIPGMMFKGPGIFGGPGISGGIMPEWPGMEGGGGPGDIGGMAADAQRQGVRAAIRGRQDAIMPNLADIPKKFAEERAQRQREFDAIKKSIDDALNGGGNRDDAIELAGRIGADARRRGQAKLGKDGELVPNFGDIDIRERGARGEAMRDARRRRARVPRQVAEEIERGEAPKDVAAGQEAAFNKVAEALAKKVGGDQATRDALAALMKQAVATQKDADEALKVAREAMRVIEALAANKGQRAFKP